MITPGKKALAIKGFAQALRNMPGIIADNAGYDSSELVTQLQAAHANGEVRAAQGGGRSVALPCRSSTSYQLPDSLTCSAPEATMRPNPRSAPGWTWTTPRSETWRRSVSWSPTS